MLKDEKRRFSNNFESKRKFVADLNIYKISSDSVDETRRPMNGSEAGTGGIPLYSEGMDGVYVDPTDVHSLIIGPTGSKKTRLVAIPAVCTLSAAHESLIISDPKAEIYENTGDMLRAKGYSLHVVNLRDPQLGACWNPLEIPYRLYLSGDMDRASEYAHDIAVNLAGVSVSQNDPYWDNASESLLFGLILLLFKFCLDFEKPVAAVNFANVLKLKEAIFSGTDMEIRKSELWSYAKNDDLVATALTGVVETAKDTRAGVLSVFDSKMSCFSIRPSLKAMLSGDSFDLGELRKKPTAIFIVSPDEKTGYHGLVSLFVKQSYEYLIQDSHGLSGVSKSRGIRVNYILDEFSSLPTIKDFPAMITAARSRDIRFNLFIQSRHQLTLRYKDEAETIVTNCGNWLFFTSRELSLLRELSELCGEVELSGRKQPLLSITDLQHLDKDIGEVLVLRNRLKPALTQLPDMSHYGCFSSKPLERRKHCCEGDCSIDFRQVEKEMKQKKIERIISSQSKMSEEDDYESR